jgi:hypothetical protein
VRPDREIESLEPVDKLAREPQWSEDYDLFAGVPEPEAEAPAPSPPPQVGGA